MPLHNWNCRWEPCCKIVIPTSNRKNDHSRLLNSICISLIPRKGCAHFYWIGGMEMSSLPCQSGTECSSWHRRLQSWLRIQRCRSKDRQFVELFPSRSGDWPRTRRGYHRQGTRWRCMRRQSNIKSSTHLRAVHN